MIVDNEALIVAAATTFDLDTVRPGPGEPITLAVVNDSVVAGTYTGAIGAADMAITHSDTDAVGVDALMTVEVEATTGAVFTLPASTKRYIAITALPANAVVAVSSGAEQTNL